MNIRVGNAPVSFGIFGPEFCETRQLPFGEVLDMIEEAGYEGTELGPYGYLPADPARLAEEIGRRKLALGSSFVPVRLSDPEILAQAREDALKVGRLLHTQNVEEVIVADAGDDERAKTAGRSPKGWSDAQWDAAVKTLEAVGKALFDELGMRIVVHHHAGTYFETAGEIERLLKMTNPDRINLLLDTGHCVYGGGDPLELMRRHASRIRYVHYKDIDKSKLDAVRAEKLDMKTAWLRGVFVPLGKGSVDFVALTRLLRDSRYSGWIIVEQDVVADDAGHMEPDPFRCARESRQYLRSLGFN